MKIAYIANVRMPTEKAHGIQIMKTCEALVHAGHMVELIVPQRHTHIAEDPFTYYGVRTCFEIRRLPVWDTAMYGRFGFLLQTLTFALSVRSFLRTHSFDAYYSRDEHILAMLSIPYVWESHTGAWNGAARAVARRAKHIVVISNGLKEFYISKGIPQNRITVAHDGIDLEEFAHHETKEEARTRLGLPLNQKIALYCGRLDGWKGVDTLCEAAELLQNDCIVAVIGGEPSQVQVLSEKYPLVRFLGYRPYRELKDNMQSADVLVLPNTGKDQISVSFTSPLKLFAYMTSGIPIVASDLPSIREVVDERGALFVTPDNPEALADGIVRATEEGNERAQHALRTVSLYSWEERARHLERALTST